MKKLFILASAALVLAACNNDVKIDENTAPVGSNAQKEIAFTAFSTPAKHVRSNAPIDGATFTPDTMAVAAWDATNDRDFFAYTKFTKDNVSGTWKGGKFWPLAPATINFLAYTNLKAGSATWNLAGANKAASGVTLVMGDNKAVGDQLDLMYACGTGTVEQDGNVLIFPTNVPMVFKHAQALVKFAVKAGNSTSESAITVSSITLNSVSCQGTFTVTHANWDEDKAARDADAGKNGSVSGVWSEYSTYADNIPAVGAAGYSALSTSFQDYASLMVVPAQGMASFTINYSVDGKAYNYTYTPASTTLAQATKYIYNITLTLHEIEIAPSVEAWTENGTTRVDIPTAEIAYNAASPTFEVGSAAGTYYVNITGLAAKAGKAVSVAETSDANNIISSVTVTPATIPASGVVTIAITVPKSTGANSATIKLTNTTDSEDLMSLTINQPALPVVP